MSDTTAVNDVTMPPEPPADVPAAMTPAERAAQADAETAQADVWVVGYVADSNESVLAATELVEDDTEVWLASTPDTRQTMAELDDLSGEGGVEWLAEPEPYEGSGPAPQAQLAALMGDADMLDEVESKIASLEGLVAGLMVTSLEDARFADDPDAEDDLDQTARVAAAVTAAREYLDILAHTAATSAEGEMAAQDEEAIADATDEVDADGGDAEAEAEDEDTGKRYEDLLARLGKLEATIAGLMETAVEDEELLPGDDMDRAIIDERPGMTAEMSSGGRSLSVDARKEAADEGFALPDGKLPIRNREELAAAIKLRGKVEGHSEEQVKRHIIKRARALNALNALPDDWDVSE